MEMRPGWMARSLAGNDKGRIYVIKEDGPRYVFLLDGNGRTLRKNKKHVQITHMRDDSISERLKQGGTVTDEEVRHFIRRCIREIRDCPGGTEYV